MKRKYKKKNNNSGIAIVVVIFIAFGYLFPKIKNQAFYLKGIYDSNHLFINYVLFITTLIVVMGLVYKGLSFPLKHRLKCFIFGFSQSPEKTISDLEHVIGQFNNLKKSSGRVIELEYFTASSLQIIAADGLTKPNYKVDSNGHVVSHAPRDVPDCEFFSSTNMIIEVTNMENKNQWLSEGQPIMRHLRDFEDKHNKDAICLFIAPSIHRDALNTYYMANKYEYEGKKTRIVPITIDQWVLLLKNIQFNYKNEHGYQFNSSQLIKILNYFYSLIAETKDCHDWILKINKEIENLKH